MDKVIYAIVILLLIIIALLCRWGKCMNDEFPSELNSKDRYAKTAELEQQIKVSERKLKIKKSF